MGQIIAKLNALQVARLKEPGMYADGAGLYLQVTGDGRDRVSKSWIYRYGFNGRTHDMGLGSASVVGLAAARDKAAECRRIRDAGKNPVEVRKADRAAAALAAASAMTFKECCKKYIASHRAAWRNAKHAGQWEATLATYAEPIIGKVSAQAIDTGLVLQVLEPIWREKPETASRVRGRIEAILQFAKVRGWRAGDNPAAWRGHLEEILPAPTKVRAVKHHAALPFDELPAFLADLRNQGGTAARALEFTILTVARTGETIGAAPSEINGTTKAWTVPAERMKAGKEHRVPLPPRALELAGDAGSVYLFAGTAPDRPLSNMAMTMVLRRMGRSDITVHGFRSTFRDWAAERTNFPSEVVEMALAHTIDDKVEAAYRRGDLFMKRRRLMEAWANFCATAPASKGDNVVKLKASAA